METRNKVIKRDETPLKDLIVEFVGNKINPENDEVTVGHIAQVFSEEFPEFVITIAEENWINGYTQALTDANFVDIEMKKRNELKRFNKE